MKKTNFKYVLMIGAYFLVIGLIQSSGGLNPNAVAHDDDIKVGDTVILVGGPSTPSNVTDVYGPDGMGRTTYKVVGLSQTYPDSERQWFDKSELARADVGNQFAGIRDLKGIFRMP